MKLLRCVFVAVVLTALGVNWSYSQQLSSSSDPLSETDVQTAKSLLEAYEKNRAVLKRYGVAFRVERSRESFAKDGQSYTVDDWYLHCADWKHETFRQGEEISHVLSTKDGIGVSERSMANSNVFRDGERYQLTREFFGAPIIGRKATEEEKEDVYRSTYFDPWDLPVIGSGCLMPIRVLKPVKRKLIGIENLESVKSVLPITVLTFELQKNIFCLLTFDSRVGNMPTRIAIEIREEGFSGLMQSVKTKWKLVQGAWIPIEVVLVNISGNPKAPVDKYTRHFYSSWVIEEELPDEVFSVDPDSFLSSLLLKRRLVEFATVSSEDE